MYNTTIGRALAGDIDTRRIVGHYLYIVREDETVFYVGQSVHPLTRLQDHLIGMSLLGNLITEYAPSSHKWTYDLLRPTECAAYIEILTGRQDIPRRELGKHPALFEGDLNLVEEDLIAFPHPCLNVMGNCQATPLPEQYRRRTAANSGVILPQVDEAEIERAREQAVQQRLARSQEIAQHQKAGLSPGVPPGSVRAFEFAEIHNISRACFWRHLVTGLKDAQGQRERVEHIAVPNNKPGEVIRWLTPEQQRAALDFWQRHSVSFQPVSYTVSAKYP